MTDVPIAPVAVTPGSGVSDWDDRARMTELEGYIRDAKWTEVEPLLMKYVAERPKSSWGWYALGYAYFAQKKIGESIKALATSLQLDLKNVEAHKILGRNLMIIGRFDAARTEFELAIRYKPDSAESHYNLGKLFSMQDDWERGPRGVRGQPCESIPATSRPSTVSASPWKLSATMPARWPSTRRRSR